MVLQLGWVTSTTGNLFIFVPLLFCLFSIVLLPKCECSLHFTGNRPGPSQALLVTIFQDYNLTVVTICQSKSLNFKDSSKDELRIRYYCQLRSKFKHFLQPITPSLGKKNWWINKSHTLLTTIAILQTRDMVRIKFAFDWKRNRLSQSPYLECMSQGVVFVRTN